jgi:formylglycine-generating enzyme required for sulfatase activity
MNRQRRIRSLAGAALLLAAGALAGCGGYAARFGPVGPEYNAWPFDQAEALRRQKATADALKLPVQQTVRIGSTTLTLSLIPSGAYQRGTSPLRPIGMPQEFPAHPVRISRVFYLAATEVTQGLWRQVTGAEPWKGRPFTQSGDDLAATYVNWEDAIAFCRRLSEATGRTFRLPTEAEWEYACRAGAGGNYCYGEALAKLDRYAWFDANTYDLGHRYAHRVGRKKSNAWGLYDMHGNVWEWCGDRYAADAYAKAAHSVDPTGPGSGTRRSLRGGSWYDRRWYSEGAMAPCRSAARTGADPAFRNWFIGFRVVMVP